MALVKKQKKGSTAPAKGTARLQLDLPHSTVTKIDDAQAITEEPVRKRSFEKACIMLFNYSRFEEVLKAAKLEQLERDILKARKG